jgi:uncharacterized protein YidB (DUF937 family)
MAMLALVMVLGTTTAAFAQGAEPPTPPAYGETFWQTFAEKLGVTVDKLQSALRDTLKAMVDKALTDGKLTPEQADKAKSGIDELTFDKPLYGQFWAPRGRAESRAGFAMGTEALDAAAKKLGMTTQDLMKELRGGKTLADVAKEKNVSTDDLKAAVVAAVNAQVDKAVADGKLTKDQADKIKAQMEEMDLAEFLGKGMRKGGQFGPGENGFKDMRPGGRQRNQAPEPTTPQGSTS